MGFARRVYPTSFAVAVAFWLWVVGGGLWLVATWHYADVYYSSGPLRFFRFVNPSPEEAARAQACDQAEKAMTWLVRGSLPYAILGVILFWRRGRLVFVIAAAMVGLAGLAYIHGTWVPL